MHAGSLMRRMLEFMRDGAAGRRSKEHHDREDHQPDQTFKGRSLHNWEEISKVAKDASTNSGATDPDDTFHPFVATAEIPIASILRQGPDHILAVQFVEYTEIIMGFRRIGLQCDRLLMLFFRLVQAIQTGIDHAQI